MSVRTAGLVWQLSSQSGQSRIHPGKSVTSRLLNSFLVTSQWVDSVWKRKTCQRSAELLWRHVTPVRLQRNVILRAQLVLRQLPWVPWDKATFHVTGPVIFRCCIFLNITVNLLWMLFWLSPPAAVGGECNLIWALLSHCCTVSLCLYVWFALTEHHKMNTSKYVCDIMCTLL